jgi:hypothetical protein
VAAQAKACGYISSFYIALDNAKCLPDRPALGAHLSMGLLQLVGGALLTLKKVGRGQLRRGQSILRRDGVGIASLGVERPDAA